MFGGDITVRNSSAINISGNLDGTVKDLRVGDNARLVGNKINVKSVQNLNVGNNGLLHTKESLQLTVTGGYNVLGTIQIDFRKKFSKWESD